MRHTWHSRNIGYRSFKSVTQDFTGTVHEMAQLMAHGLYMLEKTGSSTSGFDYGYLSLNTPEGDTVSIRYDVDEENHQVRIKEARLFYGKPPRKSRKIKKSEEITVQVPAQVKEDARLVNTEQQTVYRAYHWSMTYDHKKPRRGSVIKERFATANNSDIKEMLDWVKLNLMEYVPIEMPYKGLFNNPTLRFFHIAEIETELTRPPLMREKPESYSYSGELIVIKGKVKDVETIDLWPHYAQTFYPLAFEVFGDNFKKWNWKAISNDPYAFSEDGDYDQLVEKYKSWY